MDLVELGFAKSLKVRTLRDLSFIKLENKDVIYKHILSLQNNIIYFTNICLEFIFV